MPTQLRQQDDTTRLCRLEGALASLHNILRAILNYIFVLILHFSRLQHLCLLGTEDSLALMLTLDMCNALVKKLVQQAMEFYMSQDVFKVTTDSVTLTAGANVYIFKSVCFLAARRQRAHRTEASYCRWIEYDGH